MVTLGRIFTNITKQLVVVTRIYNNEDKIAFSYLAVDEAQRYVDGLLGDEIPADPCWFNEMFPIQLAGIHKDFIQHPLQGIETSAALRYKQKNGIEIGRCTAKIPYPTSEGFDDLEDHAVDALKYASNSTGHEFIAQTKAQIDEGMTNIVNTLNREVTAQDIIDKANSWYAQCGGRTGLVYCISEGYKEIYQKHYDKYSKFAAVTADTRALIAPTPRSACTCGSQSVGSGSHSTWCDSHK